ncbi:hypothetical protein [Eubacterium limosum]|uniref:hypothetical protein n=1 Tax=Eubacterium limosum TaxID=1736 RepID=UPI0022E947CE|nr:hypothetical protein [Eubacterium limosum]
MIRLDENFRLDNDDRCYILQERKIVKNGENKGAERWENVCCPSTLESALKTYRDLLLKRRSAADKALNIERLIYLIKEQDKQFLQGLTKVLKETGCEGH